MDDLTTIKGIGKATAKKLEAEGIKTPADLAHADAKALSAKPGFGTEAEISDWIKAAAEIANTAGNITITEGGDNADATVPASQGAADGSGEAGADASQPDATATPVGNDTQGTNTPQSEEHGGTGDGAGPAQALNFGLDFRDVDSGIAVITRLGTVLFRDEEHTREITVTGPRNGRWRAGILFGREARAVSVTATQLEQIDNDPVLAWAPAPVQD